MSGHANVDFHYGVVQFLVTPLLDWPRQCTASFNLKRGNSWQLAGGSGDARPIFDGKLLRQGASWVTDKATPSRNAHDLAFYALATMTPYYGVGEIIMIHRMRGNLMHLAG